MKRTISIGEQIFFDLRRNGCFYIDKTELIRELWESNDKVTLIIRPRRFGKTLNMSMLECFFSNKYAGRSDLFEGLKIWDYKEYRDIQGTYPVIFLSFAKAKASDYKTLRAQIITEISDLFNDCDFLLDGDILNDAEKKEFKDVRVDMDDSVAVTAINKLCKWFHRYYDKNVIILLDEYDTPMQEAWLSNNWEKITDFFRSFFNATFKTNSYLERAVMTGITRVSKESMFSDLNNLNVVTTTSSQYGQYFGFTEGEVFAALDEMEMSDQKEKVKEWYDGFTFGEYRDIYNPWSITNFLKKKKYEPYWVDTSSNGLVSELLGAANVEVKNEIDTLMRGGCIERKLDEQIVFSNLESDEDALWSLLLASGYLRVEDLIYDDDFFMQPTYVLKLTNREVLMMFHKMVRGWFGRATERYNGFIKALLRNDLREMNLYMNDVALATFSVFDSGTHPSDRTQPERFYHGFVLGLLVELRGRYEVISNAESGYGRYDVMLVPLKNGDPAYIFEFKVIDKEEGEKTLADTVAAAKKQICEMNYAARLKERDIDESRIHTYGFAFEGKTVLIG